MQARAREADEGSEFGRGPLWGGGGAVAACRVTGEFLEGEELSRGGVSERKDGVMSGEKGKGGEGKGGLHTLLLVSGSTSHIVKRGFWDFRVIDRLFA